MRHVRPPSTSTSWPTPTSGKGTGFGSTRSPDYDHAPRGDVAECLAEVHEALGQAYEGAAAVLAGGHASPAATEARRTLEGLVKHLLERHGYELFNKTSLPPLLRELPQHVDLTQPLTETAEAVKDGGKLGAHYDMRVKATSARAREALQLVEALVDYLLILPKRVEALREHLEAATRWRKAATSRPAVLTIPHQGRHLSSRSSERSARPYSHCPSS